MLVTHTDCRIISPEGIMTRERLERDVTIFSRMLALRGIPEEGRVILKAANSYYFVVSLFSLCNIAVSVTVVDEQTVLDEVAQIYDEAAACCILTDCDLELPHALVILIQDLIQEEAVHPHWVGEPEIEALDFNKWCERPDALILYSSGTTGKPKGIVKAGSAFMENIRHSIHAMNYLPSDHMLPVVPFSHFYGISLIFSWWLTSCSLIICNPKNLWSVIASITKDRATVVDANPSAFYTLLRMLSRKPEQLEMVKESPVRMWCVGGSPLTQDLEEKFNNIFGQPLLNGYGLSELGNVTLGTLECPQGCGKPLPGVDLKILDAAGSQQADGIVGEVWIRSAGCMEGYLNRPDLTQSVLQDGWFKTGDLGYLDDEMLYVIGRSGKTVNRMGYMVSPVYIEDRIGSLGYRSCVITLEDEAKGTLLIAYIEGESSQALSVLRKEMNRVLPSYMFPDLLLPLAHFPLNRNGKVNRLEMERIALEKVASRKV
ncbi:class I adenylate-forming enzyme family protein [Paenibacillus brasilensis]|uniref:Acyl-CoA synthetase (AMP-forming)/AMP-acid ligase II n=1 Tax=Paenibacillus brasilensis TaxID=128574 RepID=A0ABU0L2N6_9BACL|nr:fatty acid--CoA ligase family protein [Paenibacillus brasilensis]MDQ0495071.1 acyl-CoA synthetase (AMP-forming)/AMP-acid ligase II [Paenibacillus brasilensis]